MSRFVLVHGSWHGSWVWDAVTPILRAAGHDISAPDLPGRGADPRPRTDLTLADHVDRVAEAIGTNGPPVILVGHSFGGFVISHVAERMPDRIRLLVYLAAFLLRRGETVLGVGGSVPPTIPHLEVREDDGVVAVRPEAARKVFYDDCSAEDAARASARLVPEALAPRRMPAEVTDERFGRVPRVYIETLNDRALRIALQRRMHTALPCRAVVSMPSGHSPFLSMPAALAEHLLAWSGAGAEPAHVTEGWRQR